MFKKLIILTTLGMASFSALSQSGCCSWHDGVDYCGSDGHVYCRDGTRSPSCTCGYQDNEQSSINDDTNKKFNLFSSRDMATPNPYLEPVISKWLNKNS